jgi:restriction system protein
MTRRRNSLAEDFMDVVSRLPWWAAVLLAIASYVILGALAGGLTAPLRGPQDPASLVFRTAFLAAAWAGSYLVPMLCIAAALISFLRRRRRSKLMSNVLGNEPAAAVAGLSWREFELLVAESFHMQGFTVQENFDAGPDGGVDLVMKKEGEVALVQCKHWKSLKVGVAVVRELFGVMAARGAASGYVVTSGRFTEEAKSFAQGRNVHLIDGPALAAMLRAAQSAAGMPKASRAANTEVTCPKCGAAMVKDRRAAGRMRASRSGAARTFRAVAELARPERSPRRTSGALTQAARRARHWSHCLAAGLLDTFGNERFDRAALLSKRIENRVLRLAVQHGIRALHEQRQGGRKTRQVLMREDQGIDRRAQRGHLTCVGEHHFPDFLELGKELFHFARHSDTSRWPA